MSRCRQFIRLISSLDAQPVFVRADSIIAFGSYAHHHDVKGRGCRYVRFSADNNSVELLVDDKLADIAARLGWKEDAV